jgi:uncharacterized Zn-finger protein
MSASPRSIDVICTDLPPPFSDWFLPYFGSEVGESSTTTGPKKPLNELGKYVQNAGAPAVMAPDTPLTCSQCNRSFSARRYLSKHERSHRDGPVSCPLCNRLFETKTRLSRHQKLHKEKEVYSCNEDGCRGHYGRKADLDRHMRTVGRTRRAVWVEVLTDQQAHPRIHTIPYVCRFCAHLFSRKDTLDR